MNMKEMVASLAVAALPLGLFVGHAAAETASDTVDVYAGLAPVLELACSDVNFGVWRVPTGARGAVNTIALLAGSQTEVGGTGSGAIALSANYLAPQAGYCSVSGSTVADNATGVASIGLATGTMISSGAAAGGNIFAAALAGPDAVAAMSYTLAISVLEPVITSGQASFNVTGVLTIPAELVSDNYGAYKGSVSHTVSFADAPQG